jgi:hypothetical protein
VFTRYPFLCRRALGSRYESVESSNRSVYCHTNEGQPSLGVRDIPQPRSLRPATKKGLIQVSCKLARDSPSASDFRTQRQLEVLFALRCRRLRLRLYQHLLPAIPEASKCHPTVLYSNRSLAAIRWASPLRPLLLDRRPNLL